MELSVHDPGIFRRLLSLRGPALPRVEDFQWTEGRGRITYAPEKSAAFPAMREAAWAHFGFHFSQGRKTGPDIPPDLFQPSPGKWITIPTGKKGGPGRAVHPDSAAGGKQTPHPAAWMETFPESWEALPIHPLYVLVEGRHRKGHSAAARHFLHRFTAAGRGVVHLDFTFFADAPGAGWRALQRALEAPGGGDAVVLDHVDRSDAATFQRVLDLLLRAPDRGYAVVATGWPGGRLDGYEILPLPELTLPRLLTSVYFPGVSASWVVRALQEAGRTAGLKPGEIMTGLAPQPDPCPDRLSPEAMFALKALAIGSGTLPAPWFAAPVRRELETAGRVRLRDGILIPSMPASPGPLSEQEAGALLKKVWFREFPPMARLHVESAARPGSISQALEQKLEAAAREGDLFQLYDLLPLAARPEDWAPFAGGWEGNLDRFLPQFEERSDDPTLQMLAFLFEWETMAGGALEPHLAEGWRALLKARSLKKEGRLQGALDLLRGTAASGGEPVKTLAELIEADFLAENGRRGEAAALLERSRGAFSGLPPLIQAYHHRYTAYVLYACGRFREAIAMFDRWRTMASQHGWFWQEALAVNDIGAVASDRKDLPAAHKAFSTAARFARVLGETKRLNLMRFNLATVALDEGDLQLSEAIFQETSRANRARKDASALFFDLAHLGRIHYLRGRHESARDAVEEMDALHKELQVHPCASRLFLLKTELAKWGPPEEYRKALEALKAFPFQPGQDGEEAQRLMAQGALRKITGGPAMPKDPWIKTEKHAAEISWDHPPAFLGSLPGRILILEWDRFHPGKVPAAVKARTLEALKEAGAPGWEQVAQSRVDLSLRNLFAFLSRSEFVPASGPVPFNLTLPDGRTYAHGEVAKGREIPLPNAALLKIPEARFGLMPVELWTVWGLALQSRLERDTQARPGSAKRCEVQTFHGFVYACGRSAQAVAQAQKFARTSIAVHLAGETGSGKEVMAQAIHKASSRRNGPFIPVNCASIPESLFEAELFGWRKGAFTGALLDKPGIVEAAHGGTLFLDEVGDLPPSMQAKLLRVLNDRKIQRLGDTFAREVDFRLITATNRNLKERVREGAFREDLYFRIAVGVVDLPPLRERREDIPFIARALLEKNRHLFDMAGVEMHPLYVTHLMEQAWPGNVRELENHLLSCLVHVQGGEALSMHHVHPSETGADEPGSSPKNYQELMRGHRRRIMFQALEQAGWNRAAAAKLLEITPQALGYQMRELDIRREKG